LPLGAVPQPAAHGDAIRAAHRAGGRRAHLSLRRRRLRRRRHRLGVVLRRMRARRRAEPRAARVAAAKGAFYGVREGWVTRRSCSGTTSGRLNSAQNLRGFFDRRFGHALVFFLNRKLLDRVIDKFWIESVYRRERLLRMIWVLPQSLNQQFCILL